MTSLDVSLSNLSDQVRSFNMTGRSEYDWNMNRTIETDSGVGWIAYIFRASYQTAFYSFKH